MSFDFQRFRNTIALGIALGTALVGSGCSVALDHAELAGAPRTYSDPVDVSGQSEGINGKVGWGRITVFYIPCVPVYIQGDGNQEVMEQIRDAMQAVGYKVSMEDTAPVSGRAPLLKCKIDNFWFNNYTWFFPIFVPTWGDIDMTLSLQRPGGQIPWQRTFHGHGFSVNFFNGYSNAANEAMTEILNQMVQAFATEEFHNALVRT